MTKSALIARVVLMNTTNEIGFDGQPRFRTEIRKCLHFSYRSLTSCGREFSVTIDRHSLDDGSRTCERCRQLPTSSVRATALTPNGSHRIEIYPHTNIVTGGERTYDYSLMRRIVARAVSEGCTDVRLEMTRHTNKLGRHTRRWIKFSPSAAELSAVVA